MNLLQQLSSVVGDKTEEANRIVAGICLREPSRLVEVVEGLQAANPSVVADCAEVLTKVAEEKPILVAPYLKDLLPLLATKTTKIRWESMHAIALVASFETSNLSSFIPTFLEMIRVDTSTIVRDYAIEAIGHLAKASAQNAIMCFPVLKEGLQLWDGKHRGRILKAMEGIIESAPEHAIEIRGIAEEYVYDNRGVVKKAAKALIKAIDFSDKD